MIEGIKEKGNKKGERRVKKDEKKGRFVKRVT